MLVLLIALSARVAAASPLDADPRSDAEDTVAIDPDADPDPDPDPDPDHDPDADPLADIETSPDDVDPARRDERSAWGVASEELREGRKRRSRTLIGRVDLSVMWRRSNTLPAAMRDELWLLATWGL